MRVLITRGETAGALVVYEQLRRPLRDELGVEPAAGAGPLPAADRRPAGVTISGSPATYQRRGSALFFR